MSDFQNFLTKAAELYLAAPLFFNWAAPIVVAIVGGLIWLAYWVGGKFADSEINGLKAQIAAFDQRFNFAKDQVASSTKEATDVRSQLDKLKGQIAVHAPVEQLQDSTALLEGNLIRLLTANTAASETLTHRSTGFDEAGQLIWKPTLPPAHSRAHKKRE